MDSEESAGGWADAHPAIYEKEPQENTFKHWKYEYDEATNSYICPEGEVCGANEKEQKLLTKHIWQGYLDLAEALRKVERGKQIYARRKETTERVFADTNEKHGMRYTQHRGLARVTTWVRLKFAAMNMKELAIWIWGKSCFSHVF